MWLRSGWYTGTGCLSSIPGDRLVVVVEAAAWQSTIHGCLSSDWMELDDGSMSTVVVRLSVSTERLGVGNRRRRLRQSTDGWIISGPGGGGGGSLILWRSRTVPWPSSCIRRSVSVLSNQSWLLTVSWWSGWRRWTCLFTIARDWSRSSVASPTNISYIYRLIILKKTVRILWLICCIIITIEAAWALDTVHNSRRSLDQLQYVLYFVICDLDLWTFNLKTISLVGYPEIIPYTPNLNTLESLPIRFSVIVRT